MWLPVHMDNVRVLLSNEPFIFITNDVVGCLNLSGDWGRAEILASK